MSIVVVTRCLNEENNIIRFVIRYSTFADKIIISDGGSTDSSLSKLQEYIDITRSDKIILKHFTEQEHIGAYSWNPDHSHINFVIDEGKKLKPDWLILDDMDDIPSIDLCRNAGRIFNETENKQINAFRLYMWGRNQYFPKMNNYFDPNYTSLWAWKPRNLDIHADPTVRHGTIVGIDDNPRKLEIPNVLLHYSWSPETIHAKLDKYNTIGLPMNHPFEFAGEHIDIPEWIQ